MSESHRAPVSDLTFDELVRGYLEDYELHGYRAIKSARSRIAQLRRRFGNDTARSITGGAIRHYQLERRRAGAATGTINRETSALCFDSPSDAAICQRCLPSLSA
jgi:hypothetical protein